MDDNHFVPGTVHLVDLEGVLNAKHASGPQRDIILVPAPSSDPDDPLNWSPRRKQLAATCICVFVAPHIDPKIPNQALMVPNQLYVRHCRNVGGHLFRSQAHRERFASFAR